MPTVSYGVHEHPWAHTHTQFLPSLQGQMQRIFLLAGMLLRPFWEQIALLFVISMSSAMSSSTVCSSDGKLCTQEYPVKDYFLALFVIVVCLVGLRMLLYASYYSWTRISSMRQQQGNARQAPHPDLEPPYMADRSNMAPTTPSGAELQVCVIVAGDDRPTFIALPAPLAPSRSPNSQATSMKTLEVSKNWSIAFVIQATHILFAHSPWQILECQILAYALTFFFYTNFISLPNWRYEAALCVGSCLRPSFFFWNAYKLASRFPTLQMCIYFDLSPACPMRLTSCWKLGFIYCVYSLWASRQAGLVSMGVHVLLAAA